MIAIDYLKGFVNLFLTIPKRIALFLLLISFCIFCAGVLVGISLMSMAFIFYSFI